jgi:vacuolar iron transporter family protein
MRTPQLDTDRYRENLRAERESAALYQAFAQAERDERLAAVYRAMATVEERHAAIWAEHLQRAGTQVPAFAPSWRVRLLRRLARRFGPGAVLPFVSGMERGAAHVYDAQPEAKEVGMPREERSHARVFQALETATRGGIS